MNLAIDVAGIGRADQTVHETQLVANHNAEIALDPCLLRRCVSEPLTRGFSGVQPAPVYPLLPSGPLRYARTLRARVLEARRHRGSVTAKILWS